MAEGDIDIPVNLVVTDTAIKRLLQGRAAELKVTPKFTQAELRRAFKEASVSAFANGAKLTVVPTVSSVNLRRSFNAAVVAAFGGKSADLKVNPVVSQAALNRAFRNVDVPDVRLAVPPGGRRPPSSQRAPRNPAQSSANRAARQQIVQTAPSAQRVLRLNESIATARTGTPSLRDLQTIQRQADQLANALTLKVELAGTPQVRADLESLLRQTEALQRETVQLARLRSQQISQAANTPLGIRRGLSSRFERDPDVERLRRDRQADVARRRSAATEVVLGSRESQSARLFRSVGRVGSELGPAAVAIGLIARGAGAAFIAFRQLTAEVRETANAAQLTARDASTLLAITKQVGIDPDKTSRALVQFAKNADDPRLKNFGLFFKGIEDGSVDTIDALGQVADQFVSLTGKQAEQSNLLFAVFGRQADTLVPLLEKGSAGIRELSAAAALRGEIFSEADLSRAKQLELQIKNLQQQLKGSASSAIGDLAPAIGGAANFFSTLIQDTSSLIKIAQLEASAALNFIQGDAASTSDALSKLKGPEFANLGVDQLAEFQKNSGPALDRFSADFVERINRGTIDAKSLLAKNLGTFSIGGGQGLDLVVGQDRIIELVAEVSGTEGLNLLLAQYQELEKSGFKVNDSIAAVSRAIEVSGDSAVNTQNKTDLWRSAVSIAAVTVDDLREALDGSTETAEAFAAAIQTQIEALAELPAARRAVESAVLSQAKAERELNEAIRDSSSVSLVSQRRAVGEKIERLEIIESRKAFGRSIVEADRSALSVERAIGDNRADQAGNLRSIAKAERDYQRALEDTPRSLRGIAEAELALLKARQEAADLPLRIAASERSVRDARLSQSDGLVTLARSQQDYAKTVSRSAAELSILNAFGGVQQDQADKVAAAQRDVTSAQRDRNNVTREQINNIAELTRASEGLTGVTRTYGEFLAAQKAALAVNTEQPQSERLAEAEEKIRAAQKELARTQAGLNNIDPTSFERAPQDAARALRDARISAGDAPIEAAEAETALARLRATGALEASLSLAAAEDSLTDARRANVDQTDELLDRRDAILNAQDQEADRLRTLEDLYRRLDLAKSERASLQSGGLAALKLEAAELDLQLGKQQAISDSIGRQEQLVELRLSREEAVTAEVDARLTLINIENEAIGVFDNSLKKAQDRLIALGANITALDLANPTLTVNVIGKTPFISENQAAQAKADRDALRSKDETFLARSGPLLPDITADTKKIAELQLTISKTNQKIESLEDGSTKGTIVELDELKVLLSDSIKLLAALTAKQAPNRALTNDLRQEGSEVVKRQQGLVSESQTRIDVIKEELKVKGITAEKAALLKVELENLQAAIKIQKELLELEKKRLAELNKRLPVGPPAPIAREKGGSYFPGQVILSNERGPERWADGSGSWVNTGGPRVDVARSIGYITPHNITPASPVYNPTPVTTTTTTTKSTSAGPVINVDLTLQTRSETPAGQAMEMAAAFGRALLLSI